MPSDKISDVFLAQSYPSICVGSTRRYDPVLLFFLNRLRKTDNSRSQYRILHLARLLVPVINHAKHRRFHRKKRPGVSLGSFGEYVYKSLVRYRGPDFALEKKTQGDALPSSPTVLLKHDKLEPWTYASFLPHRKRA